jgi:nicotinate-nucleotide adenylyltransferase
MVELEPKASSYSIDAMDKLTRRMKLKKRAFYFIAGGDSLLEINTWRQSEKLLNSYNFVFVERPGIEQIDARDILSKKAYRRVRDYTGLKRAHLRQRIAEEAGDSNRIYILDIDAPDISATQIRRAASLRKPIHRLVPGPVGEYIRKLHLYGGR